MERGRRTAVRLYDLKVSPYISFSGKIYSLFPAICSDLFGQKFATTNSGLLYTAKGTASFLIPVGSLLQAATGSWMPIFLVAIAFDWAAALLALFVLKPSCARWVASQASVLDSATAI
jgi:OFA family oxalate/formate antiporter-like MFS transporter